MSFLIVSDIHGNLAALDAVLATAPDARVICLGDIVGYGPQPAACVQRIMERAEVCVLGNHDRALVENVSPRCRQQFRWLADATASIGARQISSEQLAFLGGLPKWAVLDVYGARFMFVHATPRDPLYRYVGADPGVWRAEVQSFDADVLLVGHTHLPFAIDVDGTRVVNPGSVGQPKDGDPRAAYAVIDEHGIRFGRVEYPVEETVASLECSGVSADAVAELASILRSGRAPSLRIDAAGSDVASAYGRGRNELPRQGQR